MKTITENAILTETICPSKNVLKYEEKVYVNRGESLIKVDPSYYIKQKVLNIQNLNYLLSSYSEFFENYRILCILSALNIFIILFLLLLYLLFSLIIFLPAFFLLCSIFCSAFPLLYPLIKDKTQIILKEEIIFCTCITIGSTLFFISILFIYLTPFVSVFLYPFNAIFMPLISTLILPMIMLINSSVCAIYVIFYTEAVSSVKNLAQNTSRYIFFKIPLFYL
ncbi:conserved Plasmodium membrane protein, unknown function [Plasmodium gonderi]|uniref:Uncharacterized protein n=1 Tax=Plasmodium gonderi TaxID=77519 RepID=A0A1Y1JMN7_PLAGO|nr:conserved Plasmodium membrane protein, unknown function [Plasmodium gonderi]GAW82102.1 conserved Plasmodium membrane protein, unknown function [Plasmodium gonderi]